MSYEDRSKLLERFATGKTPHSAASAPAKNVLLVYCPSTLLCMHRLIDRAFFPLSCALPVQCWQVPFATLSPFIVPVKVRVGNWAEISALEDDVNIAGGSEPANSEVIERLPPFIWIIYFIACNCEPRQKLLRVPKCRLNGHLGGKPQNRNRNRKYCSRTHHTVMLLCELWIRGERIKRVTEDIWDTR